MLCRPADAVIRPAQALIQPRVPVGGRDPLGFAPLQQGGDQRMGVAQLPQPPGPGVRDVDADPGQQRADLGRAAQVGRGPGGVPQHLGVARGPARGGLGVAARPGPDEPGQHLLGDRTVHRQAVR
jgi:hypothetical protein